MNALRITIHIKADPGPVLRDGAAGGHDTIEETRAAVERRCIEHFSEVAKAYLRGTACEVAVTVTL